MSAFNAGDDSSYGLDLLSLKTEDGDGYLPHFRLYSRPGEEEDVKTGGGSDDTYNRYESPTTGYTSTRAHGHSQQLFTNFPRGSSNVFGSTDEQLSMPQTSSPTSYGPEMGYPSQYYSASQYGDTATNSNYLPQVNVGQSQHWTQSMPLQSIQDTNYESSPSQARIYYRDQYQYRSDTAGTYHSSSSSSGHNSYESLPDASSVETSRRQETIENVRRRYNIPDGIPVNLNAIPDPPLGQKPSEKHAKLVHLAIAGSPNLRLSLREIYHAIEERFPYYKNLADKKWQGSIRHMLSLKAEFISTPRPITEPGQGQYWSLNMNMTGDKRVRKRRSRPRHRAESTDSQNEDEAEPDPASPSAESQDSMSSRGGARSSPNITSTTFRHQNRTSPYIANDVTLPRPSSRASTSRFRETLRRSDSESNLLTNVESLNIRSTARAIYPQTYMGPPPVQAPYRGTWSSQHSHHAIPSREPAIGYNYPNPPYYSSLPSPVIQRPSFPMPAMNSYPPIPSAPTRGLMSGPETSSTSGSSSGRMVASQAARPIFIPRAEGSSDSSSDASRSASANAQGKSRAN